MENFLYCVNATLPLFLLIAIGYFLRHRTTLLDDEFATKLNRFAFKTAIPVQLFQGMYAEDFHTVWNGRLVLFCLVGAVITIVVSLAASIPFRDRSERAEFTQASYRGSQAFLGAALLENLYGKSSALSMVMLGSVPLYNVVAVLLLTLLAPGSGKLDRKTLRRALREIVMNPIIWGIFAGLLWSVLRLPHPVVMERVVSNVAGLSAPLLLFAIGAKFDPAKIRGTWKPITLACVLRLVVFSAALLPAAIALGFRNGELVSILVMLASPTATGCFTMAYGMGHPGTVSSGTIMLSMALSVFTLTGWLYLLKMLALI